MIKHNLAFTNEKCKLKQLQLNHQNRVSKYLRMLDEKEKIINSKHFNYKVNYNTGQSLYMHSGKRWITLTFSVYRLFL